MCLCVWELSNSISIWWNHYRMLRTDLIVRCFKVWHSETDEHCSFALFCNSVFARIRHVDINRALEILPNGSILFFSKPEPFPNVFGSLFLIQVRLSRKWPDPDLPSFSWPQAQANIRTPAWLWSITAIRGIRIRNEVKNLIFRWGRGYIVCF